MNTVFIAQSIDGYIADKKGNIDWLYTIPNPEQNDMGYGDFMNRIDAIIMGRKTFETVLAFGIEWPYSKPVVVLSTSLTEIPHRLKEKVLIRQGSPTKIIQQLKQEGYLNFYIDGGTCIQNFLQEDLIDELIITTIPILLGGGYSLFGALNNRLLFECVGSKVYLNNIIQTHYKRKTNEDYL